MKPNFKFNIGNRGLLEEELGLAEQVNDSFRASAEKHGVKLNPEALVAVKITTLPSGKTLRQVSSINKDPIDIPVA